MVSEIAEISVMAIARAILPFLLAGILTLIVVTYWSPLNSLPSFAAVEMNEQPL